MESVRSPEAAVLRIRTGPYAGSWYEFTRRRVRLGRAVSCDIVLDHLSVASEHAVVEHAEGGHVLSDTGTLTGTYLNRERVLGRAELREGDEVRIGVYRLIFHAPRITQGRAVGE